MANLDEPNADSAGGANGTPDHAEPSSGEQRLKELERENAKLRAELAETKADAQALWRTIRAVAPAYAVTEAEMREVMENPIPLRDALAGAERLLGAGHGD